MKIPCLMFIALSGRSQQHNWAEVSIVHTDVQYLYQQPSDRQAASPKLAKVTSGISMGFQAIRGIEDLQSGAEE